MMAKNYAHSLLFIRTIFMRTLRLRFAAKFKKMYGLNKNILRLNQILRVLIKKRMYDEIVEHTLSKMNEIVTFSFRIPKGSGSTVLATILLCNSRFVNVSLR